MPDRFALQERHKAAQQGNGQPDRLGHCRQNCHGDIRTGEQTILDYLI